MLILLFIYFQGKTNFLTASGRSSCFKFLFLFRFTILLFNMKSLFYSLWKFAKFLISFLKAQVSFTLNFASIFSAIKHNTFLCFLAQTLYILFKRNPLKYKLLRLSSARVKIRKNPLVNFETTSPFLFIFYIIFQCQKI